MGFHNSAAAMPAPFMAIVEPRLMMRVPLEITWPGAFVALAGCLESYVAGRGFVPDLMRWGGGGGGGYRLGASSVCVRAAERASFVPDTEGRCSWPYFIYSPPSLGCS